MVQDGFAAALTVVAPNATPINTEAAPTVNFLIENLSNLSLFIIIILHKFTYVKIYFVLTKIIIVSSVNDYNKKSHII